MLKLEFECDTREEARMYINALEYHNLINDFANALRNQRKHGTSGTLAHLVDMYYDDFQHCASLEGPY